MNLEFDIKQLEQYIFSKKKEDFFKTLVLNSQESNWFRLLHSLTQKEKLSSDDQQLLKKIIMDNGNIKEYKYRYRCRLELMNLLKEYFHKDTNQNKKKEIINILRNDYFQNYAEPIQIDNQIEDSLITKNYNYIQKQQIQNNQQHLKNTHSSIIDNKSLTLQEYVDQAYSDKYKLSHLTQINSIFISRIDLDKFLSKSEDYQLEKVLNNSDIHAFKDKGVDACIELYKRYNNIIQRTFTKSASFDSKIMNRLTIEQLEKFGNKCSNILNLNYYWRSLFLKIYGENFNRLLIKKFSELTIKQRQERKKLLYDIQKWALKNITKKELQTINELIFYEIMVYEAMLEEFDDKKLIQYLESPVYYPSSLPFIKAHKEKLEKLEKGHNLGYGEIQQMFNPTQYSETELIKEYLIHIFRSAETWKPYDKYLQEDYLKNLFYSTKLSYGYEQDQKKNPQAYQQLQNSIKSNLTQERLQFLIESKELTICNTNNRYFDTTDEIQLLVNIKNIQNLSINVYEINTENYYLKTQKAFDNEITLEGISPQYHQEFAYSNDNPAHKILRLFKFPELNNIKRGLFVIEFCGKGLISRSVIRKGSLTCIEKLTLTGHILTIINEDLQICTPTIIQQQKKQENQSQQQQQQQTIQKQKTEFQSNPTGIWLNSRFLPVNEQGQIIVPFLTNGETNEKQQSIVIVHDGFAELFNITLWPEQYTFNCSYIYNEENFLRGNKATIIIHPFLFLNGVPANMKIINNPLVQVTLFNDLNIPSTFTFKDIKFDHKQDIVAELPIQNSLRKVLINVTGSIAKLDGSTQSLQNTHEISFDLYDQDNKYLFVNMYLKKVTQKDNKISYFLYVLGKGGEPKKYVLVNLSFINKYIDSIFNYQTLITNEQGCINLGSLSEIVQVTAAIQDNTYLNQAISSQRVWILHNVNKIQYPDQISIAEGDKITLPAANDSEISKNIYELYRYLSLSQNEEIILTSHLENIIYNNKKIILQKLLPGKYKMLIKELGHTININVYPGKYWNVNNSYILSPGFFDTEDSNPQNALSLFESNNNINSGNIFIDSIQFQKSKEKQNDKNLADIQIKVILPETNQQQLQQELDCLRAHVFAYTFCPDNLNTNVKQLRNCKKSNNSLMNSSFRSNQAAFLNGKQLGDEACYILQRQKEKLQVGNTLEKPNILLKRTFMRETEFNKESLNQDSNFSEKLQDGISQQLPGSKKKKDQRNCMSSSNYNGGLSIQQWLNQFDYKNKQFDSMLNFLQYPSNVYSNLRANNKGIIEIKNFPIGQYQTIQVILTNAVSSVTDVFNVPTAQEINNNIREMKMNSLLNKDINYCEKRSSILLRSEEKAAIQSDTQFIIIDNIAQFFDIQSELILCMKEISVDNENEVGYKFWDFLKIWHTFSKEQKLQKYNQYACHELNIFLFFKDHEFFNQVVPGFITNKIEKTFIDFFLLNNKNQLNRYAKTEFISQLNALEKCLLIIYLIRNGQKQQAIAISDLLDLQVKNLTFNTSLRQRLFDTVIQAKTKSNEVQKLNQIQQKKMNFDDMSNLVQENQCQIQFDLCCEEKKECLYEDDMEAEGEEMQINYEEEDEQFECIKQKECEEESKNVELKRIRKKINKKQLDCDLNDELDDDLAEKYIQNRNQYRPPYQKMKQTKEYIERGYYNQKNPKDSAQLIQVNAFWRDFAKYIIQQNGEKLENFISDAFIYSSQNHASMLCTLSVIGFSLNTQPGDYQIKLKSDRSLELQASQGLAHNLIIFQKDIADGSNNDQQNNNKQSYISGDISVTQRIFDPFDQYTYLEEEPDVQVEKPVKEFLVDKVYCLQTIITNCTSAHLEFQILVEVPQGAIPVKSAGDYTKSHTSLIQSFMTNKINTYFYFPIPIQGSSIYPATVARNDRVLSKGNLIQGLNVLPEKKNQELESSVDILQRGSLEDKLKFLNEKNLLNINIFRFRDLANVVINDKSFFLKVIEILRNRSIFNYQIWCYGLTHADEQTFEEFINEERFQQSVFQNEQNNQISRIRYFKSNKLLIDNNLIFEYHPLLSSRVHNFQNQKKSKILNNEFKQTYHNFLKYLIELPFMEPQHIITFSYYLLLQERITEAIQIFSMIDSKIFEINTDNKNNEKSKNLNNQVPTCQIQYDYLSAYLDMYQGYPNFLVARKVSEKYANYPILSWKYMFVDLANQLSEYDGDIVDISEQVDQKENDISKNIKVSENEEDISMELCQDQINIYYQNIDNAILSFYEVDLEILFSKKPFLNCDRDEFAFVQANQTQFLKFEKSRDLNNLQLNIPQNLKNKNLYIQLKSVNKIVSSNYYSSQLQVIILENYGQIKVVNQNQIPLPKVYVKTYAMKNNNEIIFYRDGYTDIRGRFNYAISSNNSLDNITKFSMFICSEDYGVSIKEAGKPNTVGVIDDQ